MKTAAVSKEGNFPWVETCKVFPRLITMLDSILVLDRVSLNEITEAVSDLKKGVLLSSRVVSLPISISVLLGALDPDTGKFAEQEIQ